MRTPPQKGSRAPTFSPCQLWHNACMDQDGTWHWGGPRFRPHCARWAPSSPPQKSGHSPSILGPFLLWPNCWMHQDATWYGGMPRPWTHCTRWEPSSPHKRGTDPTFPPFRPISIVAKWPDAPRCQLVRRYRVGLGLCHSALDSDPPLKERGTAVAFFSANVYIVTIAHLSYCWALVINSWLCFNDYV